MKSFTDHFTSNANNPEFYSVFQQLQYGELHIKRDTASGLLAIIAIHSTRLGPALGGCRFQPYHSLEAAIIDCLRLAQGMSYKAAISHLPLGGGKAVLIKPNKTYDRTHLFRLFGQTVNELGGRYITAEDSGTHMMDMDIIRTVTPYVTGNSQQSFIQKDPSILTAFGVRRGIEAAVKYQLQKDSLQNIHVAIQGVGNVGYRLAKELHQHGAILTICDINPENVKRCVAEFSAKVIAPEQIHQVACDVFAPCALSNPVNTQNINEINAPIIAGSANNQLENLELAVRLKERGILYAPDYVINAGGLIHVYAQYYGKQESIAKENVNNIYNTLLIIFECATKENLPTTTIANRLAEQRLYS
ncbi:Glu/Leu/Phe/Val dehydrogenase dimerization domain-containing protein [Candidatus Berkiella aquae]|uniref:Amino acid dehydrogenase n=1 Tax=Candidatus Berkiella aquae TaxID=295108 RepID=A0A0Q9YK36_9GAMM|nr:amino acid dehydrogenase [Candidatus Berkiella aquae]MCS5710016.1 amino acid dehydrogenase [Candidatus Berkiella aquae]